MIKSVALMLVLVLVASGAVVFLPVNAESETIVVPDDYSTIKVAVSNADEGATIYLKNGVYEIEEDQLRISKTLSIIGEDEENTVVVFPPDTRTSYGLLYEKIGFRVSADNFVISNLTITNCDVGVSVTGNWAQISHITTSGIYLGGSYCRASENKLSIACSRLNIINVGGSFNTVEHNSFPNDSGNIGCSGSFNSVIGNTDVVNGIEVSGRAHFIANNHGRHVSLSNSDSSTVYKNSLGGLSLKNCYNNTFCGNIVKRGLTQAIEMIDCSGNIFYGNYLGDYHWTSATNGHEGGNGVNICDRNPLTQTNLFYCNNFVNNFIHVRSNDSPGAYYDWDNGSVGNYWDDYEGTDANGDGIGDAPYTINGWELDTWGYSETGAFGQDHYPLMAPFDVSSVTVELPEWTYPLSLHLVSPENVTYPFSANVTLNFTINKQASWLRYSLDGQDNVTIAGNTTVSGLPSGLHNVTVYAEDPYGYRVASETVCFTIAEPEPTPEPTLEAFPVMPVAVASLASIAVLGIGLFLYFKKIKR